jgi:hypothetical protein
MSNTVIQIKRSLTNSQPPSLNVAELAYSYQSNTIFIGTPDGTGTIAIGGKAYLDIQNNIYSLVNAAYGAANSQTSSLTAANQAGVIANAAFTHSNATYGAVNSAFGVINAAFGSANTVGGYANQVGILSNAAFGLTNTTYAAVNSAFGVINAAYTSSNANFTLTNSAYTVANAAYNQANASNTWTNSTFVKLTAPSQTITGDLAITGNLSFYGNSTIIETTSLTVGDSLVFLAANNIVNDIIDIGWVANYNNGTSNVHTGLYRDHVSKEYFLFQGQDIAIAANNVLTPYANNMVNAVLNADLITSNLWLGGANAIVWIKSAYDNSNGGFGIANAGYTATNSAFGVINAAYTSVNAAYTSSNAAYTIANAAYGATNSAFGVINAAFTQSNTDNVRLTAAYTSVNAAYVVINAAYTSSNAGYVVANAAFNYANVANAYLTNTFSSAANISSGTLPSGRLSGSYTGITGVGTITVGTWNGSTVNVGYGGTGIVSATLNGVLFGGGGNAAFQVTAAGTEGQVLTASATGVPQFSMLSGGTF